MEISKNLDIILIGLNKQPIKEISIKRPLSLESLKTIIRDNFKLNTFFIYYYNNSNIEVEIKDNFEYKNINDLIFVMEKKLVEQPINSIIYEDLSESKMDLIDEKFSCNLRNEKLIENPYFCYKCQKRFCKKCLDDLNKKKPMTCPFCKYQLPIEKWETLKNFKEEKKIYLESIEKIKNLEKEKEIYNKKEQESLKNMKKLKDDLSNQITKFNKEKKNNLELSEKYKKLEQRIIDLLKEINKLKTNNNVNNQQLNKHESKTGQKNSIVKPKEINDNNNIKNNDFDTDNNSIKAFYKINKNHKGTRILGSGFVNNNKSKCKMIVNQYDICDYIDYNKYDINKDNEFLMVIFTGVNSVTDASYMFDGCTSLNSLPNINKFDTKNITNMYSMFSGCSSLNNLPDISKWDTKNVTNMGYMFYGCSSLSILPDISKWDIKNVTNIRSMFHGCKASLNIPNQFIK